MRVRAVGDKSVIFGKIFRPTKNLIVNYLLSASYFAFSEFLLCENQSNIVSQFQFKTFGRFSKKSSKTFKRHVHSVSGTLLLHHSF